MRIRRNAHNLPVWDPILLWYAKAVRAMQGRPLVDPLSWRYQAAIHGYVRASDPLQIPGETLPSAVQQATFWSRCQHGSWFFLPWHRAYLLYFERTVAATVVSLGGPADWALPFWNYADLTNPDARRMPAAFQQQALPDGSPNPLFVPWRSGAANSNQLVGSPGQASDASCLGKPLFENNGVVVQFGGGATGFAHSGRVPGECERIPHNTMHGAIGGPTGWMSAFETAALDPIFWIHHSNIDRLWELWRRSATTHLDPTAPAWETGLSFDFHDVSGNPTSIRAVDVTDLTAPLLDYDYEGMPPAAVAGPLAAVGGLDMSDATPVPELVGATAAPVTLSANATHVSFAVGEPAGPLTLAFAPAEAGAAAPSVHLVLENVKASRFPIESYEVYVNVPAGQDAAQFPQLMAGILPQFGIVEASQADGEHGGDGINCSFDITGIRDALRAEGNWNAEDLRVSFLPCRYPGDYEEVIEMAPVEVGRVSLYYA
jgi:tyrosinase